MEDDSDSVHEHQKLHLHQSHAHVFKYMCVYIHIYIFYLKISRATVKIGCDFIWSGVYRCISVEQLCDALKWDEYLMCGETYVPTHLHQDRGMRTNNTATK